MNFHQIRTSFVFKIISIYLAMMLIVPQSVIYTTYALTSGPSQPEFSSFTPIGTSDMVSLTSGDFTYNIPLMDIGGYPINIAYNSGVTTDQEASWVGLGWNLSTGQINRSVRGLPDDFDGDIMTYENSMKNNWTVGTNVNVRPSIFGFNEKDNKRGLNLGLSIQYNNYSGISMHPSMGMSFALADKNRIGFNLSSSTAEGVSVGADLPTSMLFNKKTNSIVGGSLGLSYNSRKGLNLNFSPNLVKGISSLIYNASYSAIKLNPNINITSFNDFRLFTPIKRVGMHSENYNFNAALGGSVFGIDGTVKVGGFYSVQAVKSSEKHKGLKAYGYENNEKGLDKSNVVLDFNREKDRAYSKYTKMLGSTNFTYDIYSISGQGIGGSFRPHKGQVTYVRDATVRDEGFGLSGGVEVEGGNITSIGVDVKIAPSDSHSGLWEDRNDALNYLKEDHNTPEFYEKTYYRMMDEINVDEDVINYYDKLKGPAPLRFKLKGGRFKRRVDNYFTAFNFTNNGTNEEDVALNAKLTRSKRLLRNMVVKKVTKKDASKDPFVEVSNFAGDNHTVGYKVLKPDGNTYIFGKALYNTQKREASFAVNGNVNQQTGLISYAAGTENTAGNDSGVDGYFNAVTTPPYAHTFLLTTILSSDYEDSDNIAGPSDGDIGSYTKFIYDPLYQYKWRTPFGNNKASGNPGFHSHPEDQKGSYVYGEREQTYINNIETKTHIAVFYKSDRNDAYGVKDENGGRDTSGGSPSKKLDSIKLFSKEDYNLNPDKAVPIKTVHFSYDYTLTKELPNAVSGSGKLTLKKIWFTYANSKMGIYTPYTFEYGKDKNGNIFNPDYGLKDHDIWGNYKENNAPPSWGPGSDPSTIEFPYVEQNKEQADKYARAWTLTNIGLPSGGSIEVDYESDDYQYVQNKRAMQLFKVKGVSVHGPNHIGGFNKDKQSLYDSSSDAQYIHIDISDFLNEHQDWVSNNEEGKVINAYLEGIKDQPIFFKFLLNMGDDDITKKQYDYVSGYFYIGNSANISVDMNEEELIIPMKTVDKQGGIFTSTKQVNPISKAGWYFGRNNMPRIVYSYDHSFAANNLKSIILELVSSITSFTELVSGPNGKLRSNGTAKYFVPKKSWIRLLEPNRSKLGGGSRVKEIRLNNAWEVMLNVDPVNIDLYKKAYGQTYKYEDENGYSSGVATFEPSMSKENPFVEPYYNDEGSGGTDKLLAPKDQNYFEMPIGESFFPSPTVTYSRVVVQSKSDAEYSKHGTGWIENTFYTTKDFPTETHFTPIKRYNDDNEGFITNLLNLKVKKYLTLSQGFSIIKNDMNGKQKSQKVYDQNGNLISGVDNIYHVNNGKLNNLLPVIDEKGNIRKQLIGVETDVVNDFKENISHSSSVGIDFNTQGFLLGIIPVVIPVPIPDMNSHTSALYMATSTKVVQKHGILKKKIAYDLGARITTENLAWDSQTGGVLVTKTNNEFDGDYYYTLNYPARWYQDYKSMRSASINIDMEGDLTFDEAKGKFKFSLSSPDYNHEEYLEKYLIPGDELYLYPNNGILKMWVLQTTFDESSGQELITLINKDGKNFNDCNSSNAIVTDGEQVHFKVVRSGYRNFNQANMAGVTTTQNPVYKNGILRGRIPLFYNNDLTGDTFDPDIDRIINASAITYSDFWPVPREQNFMFLSDETVKLLYDKNPIDDNIDDYMVDYKVDENRFVDEMLRLGINPYRYNIRGEWKAKASYAYVTARHLSGSGSDYQPDPKDDGYFESYHPFYVLQPTEGKWKIEKENWQKASTVTRYSPYGFELENKDALNRYSSAQYGYDNTLPVAIASNTQYREIAFDGFEDHKAVKLQTVNGFDFNNFWLFQNFGNPFFPPSYTYYDFLDSNLGSVKKYNKQHFNFEDVISDNSSAKIVKGGHTGNYSVKITPQSSLTMTKSLQECGDITNENPCEKYMEKTICGKDTIEGDGYCILLTTTQTRIDPCTVQINIDAIPNNNLQFSTIRLDEIDFTGGLYPILLNYGSQIKTYPQLHNIQEVPIGYNLIVTNNSVNNAHISIIAREATFNTTASDKITLHFTYMGQNESIVIDGISCDNN